MNDRSLEIYCIASSGSFWPVSDRAPAADLRSPLHFRLFGHLECVIDPDAEVSNGALELRMTEQELHCTQILRAAKDQRGFRASQCMGSIRGGVEADLPHPPADDPRVLPCRQMRRGMQAARRSEEHTSELQSHVN